MALNRAEIAGLQLPEIAEVLVLWLDRLDSSFDRAAEAYDAKPSLPAANVVETLERLRQVFATTIPAVRGKHHGWHDELDLLLKELHDPGVLEL